MRRRDEIIRQLRKLVPNAVLITDSEGRRTFETDALTAYRCMPLAVVLPQSTEEASVILRYCHEHKIKVVPRGAGTSLSGGALPLEDSIVLGITRMTRVLSIDEANRAARVEAGITNIAITNAAAVHGYFYAPDPSSQLACTLGGNIATNSGGAHCLKYGVTTNNLLALRIVLMNGEIIDIGGDYLDAPGYDFLGLITGSEGQFGVVTEATVRMLRRRRARGQCCSASTPLKPPAPASQASSPPASCRWPSSSWTSRRSRSARISPAPAIRSTSRPCSSSRSRAREDEIDALLDTIAEIAERYRPRMVRVSKSARGERLDLEGAQGCLRRHRPDLGLLLHGRGDPVVEAPRGADRGGRDLPPPPLPRGQYLPCR